MNITESGFCFVIMPFAREFKNQWELAIEPCIKNLGLRPWRGDDESLTTNVIMKDVTKLIYNSDVIVADITGRNPNVMYELGLAHAAKKNAIILSQDEDDIIPFDVKHIRILRYDVRDLKALNFELSKAIRSTVETSIEDKPDYFPELKIMSDDDRDELNYLRMRASKVDIEVFPPVADIFFNDKLLGESPKLLTINTDVERNTVSAAAIGYFEHHQDISAEDIKNGFIRITLELRSPENISKRVPQWLRYRKRDPHNPVLMRAIAQYLNTIGEVDEAKKEIEELITVAPHWHMAHNQFGFFSRKNPKEAIAHYKQATLLNPDNHVGYFNQACALARDGQFELCLEAISEILKNPKVMRSYSFSKMRLMTDSAFENIHKDPLFSSKFTAIAEEIHDKIAKMDI